MVAATGPQHLVNQILFEPLSSGLPAGLLASPALVHMSKGTVYIPIVNVVAQEVVLYPRTVLGTTTTSLVQDKINAVDLTALTQEEQCQVRVLLLQKYSVKFGCCCCRSTEADPIIKEFLTFRTRSRAADAAEQCQASKEILVLARQWDRLVEQEGVLYRHVILPRGDEVLQLVQYKRPQLAQFSLLPVLVVVAC
ncbi:hypothetical protein N1851_002379 [Merluccius polli]|uniref:Uncharacterized protein n=1 Tax=Merluccius polli TaxID=89951 RepID=A0AA47NC25_MERPO|nr:hypothetical protein N1851_002379 [Merluccius polli]